ncbi:MAG: thiamine diphosphokinase [Spirochaetota bacterium]|nr:MAG: thiamine diphosphokinase [Spirochaetota bacterium]
MKSFIFLHTKGPDSEYYGAHFRKTFSGGDMIICANGGYDVAKLLNIKPNIIVGDMDSLLENIIDEDIEIIKYPREKDYSDFELALKEARGCKSEKIIVYGALGGRKDHEIINLNLVVHTKTPTALIEREVEIYNVRDTLTLKNKKDSICSLASWGEGCHVCRMEGFQYCLKNEVLLPSSRGLSNLIVSKNAFISIDEGLLLVIVNNKPEIN